MSPCKVQFHKAQEDRCTSFDAYLGSWVLPIDFQSSSHLQIPQCRTQLHSSLGWMQLRRDARSYQWTQLVKMHWIHRWSCTEKVWVWVTNKSYTYTSTMICLRATTYYCPGWNWKRDGRFILRMSILDPSCSSIVVKEVTLVLNLLIWHSVEANKTIFVSVHEH